MAEYRRPMEGKIAVITGAARGIGEGIARKIAEKGGTVILTDVSDNVHKTAETIDGSAKGYVMDVSKRESVHNVVEKIIEQYGRIDALVNNAGVSKRSPFLEYTDDIRDWMMSVMLIGVWNCTQEVLGHMVKEKYGHIVNIASVSGPVVADFGQSVYCMCKAGVVGLTKSIASEFGSENIVCNAILPGYIQSKMASNVGEFSAPGQGVSIMEEIAADVPLGRLGTPADIGYLAAFLASDEASYITGETIICDGGNKIPETHYRRHISK